MFSRLKQKLFNSVAPGGNESDTPANTEQWLKQAYRHIHEGDYGSAEQLYRKVLNAEPENLDALHQFGRLKGQLGDYPGAADLLRQALSIKPDFADGHSDLGAILRLQGHNDAAIRHYQWAISLDANNITAHYNLGHAFKSAGELNKAELSFMEVLKRQPDFANAHYHLAVLQFDMEKIEQAEDGLHQALHFQPNHIDAHYSLGLLLHSKAKLDDAKAHFEKALEYQPDHTLAHYQLGRVFQAQGAHEDAVDCYHMALHFKPDFGEAHLNLGNIYHSEGNLELAHSHYTKTIALCPALLEAYYELSELLQAQGKLAEAEEVLRRALQIDPNCADTINNLGLALWNQGERLEAQTLFQKALSLNPELIAAKSNLGLVLMDYGDIEKAISHFDEALLTTPGDDVILLSRTVARLSAGDFSHGWSDYETRWLSKLAIKRPFSYPIWNGSSLTQRKILIYGEQGLGDEIMFASCLADIIPKARHCIIECHPKLEKIFQRSLPSVAVYKRETNESPTWVNEVGKIDFQIAIGSLPKYLRLDWSDFPNHSGYLYPDPERAAYWKKYLDSLGSGKKIGISWRGGTHTSRSFLRSMELHEWLPILNLPNTHFVSLQYTPCGEELAQLKQQHGIHIHHWQEAIDDYDETAALVTSLDLVISVCTALVHLTGALGKPAWVMVPATPEWRYLRKGRSMPWYPSVRLFRQETPKNWGPVIEQIICEYKTCL